MKLISLIIQGFGSFAEKTTVHFDDAMTFIMGENRDAEGFASSNAAGKSTLVDAIVWALYGRTATGSSKNQVICHFRDKAYVELKLEGLTIIREKDRKKSETLKFKRDGEDWVYGDLPIVEQLLGFRERLPFDTFCNTVFVGRSSKTVRFLDATPTERVSVFTSLLDVSRFTSAEELVAEKIREQQEEVGHIRAYLRALQDVELNLRRDAQKLSEQVTEAKERAAEGKVAKHKLLKKLDEERTTIQTALLKPPTEDMQELQVEKVGLQKSLQEAQAVLAEYKVKLSNAKPLAEGDLCPSCFRELGEDDAITLENNIDDLKELIKVKQTEMAQTANLIRTVNDKQDALRMFREQAAKAQQRLAEIAMEERDVKDSMLAPDLDRLAGLLRDKVESIKQNQVEQQKKHAELAKIMPSLQINEDIKKAFRKDIRNMLLDKVRIGLSRYSNLYLKDLSGGDYKISYPPTAKSGRESFEILLQYGGNEQDISRFSGGETWKASFAVILALRSVLEDRNNSPFQFLFVDDPLGPLDNQGASQFLSLLQRLSSEGRLPQILVTLPRDVKTDRNIKTVTVVKERKVSRTRG